MKTYKVYLTIFDKDENRITQEQKTLILKKIINEFGYNKNENQDVHYPYFYNDMFYFGSPIVLCNVDKNDIQNVLEFFRVNGFPKYWITAKHRTFSLNEVKKEKIDIEEIRTQNNSEVFLSDRIKIFVGSKSLVKAYIKNYANIKEV